jgi:hypothetical protein
MCVQTLKFKLSCVKKCDELSSIWTMYTSIFLDTPQW